jgi:hypothetical protein
VAALLSTLIPGAGQLYAGRTARGVAMLLVTAMTLAAIPALWGAGSLFLLTFLVRPWVLALLLALDLLALAFRLYAVTDAYRLAGGRMRSGRITLALLFMLVAAPHLAAGYYDLLAMQLLNDLFPGEPTAHDVLAPDGEYKLTIPVTPNRNVTPAP